MHNAQISLYCYFPIYSNLVQPQTALQVFQCCQIAMLSKVIVLQFVRFLYEAIQKAQYCVMSLSKIVQTKDDPPRPPLHHPLYLLNIIAFRTNVQFCRQCYDVHIAVAFNNKHCSVTKGNLNNKKSTNVTVCNKLLVFRVMNAGKKMEGHHHLLPLSYGLLITIKSQCINQ